MYEVCSVDPQLVLGITRMSQSWFLETISTRGNQSGGWTSHIHARVCLGGLSCQNFSSSVCWTRAGVPILAMALLLASGIKRPICPSTCGI